jgi:hypothetical protein
VSAPDTLEELTDLIRAKSDEPGTRSSPKFVELAKRITAIYPSPEAIQASEDPDTDDSIWTQDPVKQAERAGAVWDLTLPAAGGKKLLYHLVEEGSVLGLAMLADSYGLAFLPDGQVLPEERAEEWEMFMTVAAEYQRPTEGQIRRKVRPMLTQRLAPYGFVPIPTPRGFSMKFRRPVGARRQQVRLGVQDYHEKFRADVWMEGQCEPVHAILAAALGPEVELRETDYFFLLTTLSSPPRSKFYLDTDGEIEDVFDWLERKAMPVLEQIRTVPGLDRFYNEVPDDVNWRDKPIEQFTALICAHLTGNPRFVELGRRLRELAKRNDSNPKSTMRTEHLDRLLAHLRDHVKPLDG